MNQYADRQADFAICNEPRQRETVPFASCDFIYEVVREGLDSGLETEEIADVLLAKYEPQEIAEELVIVHDLLSEARIKIRKLETQIKSLSGSRS